MAISLDENQQPVDQVENTPIGVDPLEPTSTPLQMPGQEVSTEQDAPDYVDPIVEKLDKKNVELKTKKPDFTQLNKTQIDSILNLPVNIVDEKRGDESFYKIINQLSRNYKTDGFVFEYNPERAKVDMITVRANNGQAASFQKNELGIKAMNGFMAENSLTIDEQIEYNSKIGNINQKVENFFKNNLMFSDTTSNKMLYEYFLPEQKGGKGNAVNNKNRNVGQFTYNKQLALLKNELGIDGTNLEYNFDDIFQKVATRYKDIEVNNKNIKRDKLKENTTTDQDADDVIKRHRDLNYTDNEKRLASVNQQIDSLKKEINKPDYLLNFKNNSSVLNLNKNQQDNNTKLSNLLLEKTKLFNAIGNGKTEYSYILNATENFNKENSLKPAYDINGNFVEGLAVEEDADVINNKNLMNSANKFSTMIPENLKDPVDIKSYLNELNVDLAKNIAFSDKQGDQLISIEGVQLTSRALQKLAILGYTPTNSGSKRKAGEDLKYEVKLSDLAKYRNSIFNPSMKNILEQISSVLQVEKWFDSNDEAIKTADLSEQELYAIVSEYAENRKENISDFKVLMALNDLDIDPRSYNKKFGSDFVDTFSNIAGYIAKDWVTEVAEGEGLSVKTNADNKMQLQMDSAEFFKKYDIPVNEKAHDNLKKSMLYEYGVEMPFGFTEDLVKFAAVGGGVGAVGRALNIGKNSFTLYNGKKLIDAKATKAFVEKHGSLSSLSARKAASEAGYSIGTPKYQNLVKHAFGIVGEEAKMYTVFQENYKLGGGTAFYATGGALGRFGTGLTGSLNTGSRRANTLLGVPWSGFAFASSSDVAKVLETGWKNLNGGETFSKQLNDAFPSFEESKREFIGNMIFGSMLRVKSVTGEVVKNPYVNTLTSTRRLDQIKSEGYKSLSRINEKISEVEDLGFKQRKQELEQEFNRTVELIRTAEQQSILSEGDVFDTKDPNKIEKHIRNKFSNDFKNFSKEYGEVELIVGQGTKGWSEKGLNINDPAGITFNKNGGIVIGVNTLTVSRGQLEHEIGHIILKKNLKNDPKAVGRLVNGIDNIFSSKTFQIPVRDEEGVKTGKTKEVSYREYIQDLYTTREGKAPSKALTDIEMITNAVEFLTDKTTYRNVLKQNNGSIPTTWSKLKKLLVSSGVPQGMNNTKGDVALQFARIAQEIGSKGVVSSEAQKFLENLSQRKGKFAGKEFEWLDKNTETNEIKLQELQETNEFFSSKEKQIDDLVQVKESKQPYTMSKKEWDRNGITKSYEELIIGDKLNGIILKGIQGDNVFGKPKENFIEDVKTEIARDLINFNPEINNSLSGFLSNRINFAKGDVSNRYKKDKFTKSIDTEAGKVGSVKETGVEDVNMQRFEETYVFGKKRAEDIELQNITGLVLTEKGLIEPLEIITPKPTKDAKVNEANKKQIENIENQILKDKPSEKVLEKSNIANLEPSKELVKLVKPLFGKNRKEQIENIINNGELYYNAYFPKSAMYGAGIVEAGKSSTMISKAFPMFYVPKGERAIKATEIETGKAGTKSGLEIRDKLPWPEAQSIFEKKFADKAISLLESNNSLYRNQGTALNSFFNQAAKVINNRGVRKELENDKLIQQLADGKSEYAASKLKEDFRVIRSAITYEEGINLYLKDKNKFQKSFPKEFIAISNLSANTGAAIRGAENAVDFVNTVKNNKLNSSVAKKLGITEQEYQDYVGSVSNMQRTYNGKNYGIINVEKAEMYSKNGSELSEYLPPWMGSTFSRALLGYHRRSNMDNITDSKAKELFGEYADGSIKKFNNAPGFSKSYNASTQTGKGGFFENISSEGIKQINSLKNSYEKALILESNGKTKEAQEVLNKAFTVVDNNTKTELFNAWQKSKQVWLESSTNKKQWLERANHILLMGRNNTNIEGGERQLAATQAVYVGNIVSGKTKLEHTKPMVQHSVETSLSIINGNFSVLKDGKRVISAEGKKIMQNFKGIIGPKSNFDLIDLIGKTTNPSGMARMMLDFNSLKDYQVVGTSGKRSLLDILSNTTFEKVGVDLRKQGAIHLKDQLVKYSLSNSSSDLIILKNSISNSDNLKKVYNKNSKIVTSLGFSSKNKSNSELLNIIEKHDKKVANDRKEFYKSKDLNKDFNDIIQDRTGVEAFKTFSTAKASIQGKKKGNWDFYVRPAAEDFTGLIYKTLPKGKKGNDAMKWYQENLIDPFTRGDKATANERMSVLNDYKAVVKQIKDIPKTLKKEAAEGFTNEQAVRVYNWSKQDVKIPGISAKDAIKLTKAVENNAELKAFAEQIVELNKGDGYPKPGENWLTGTITTDLMAGIGKVKRKKHMEQFINNVDAIYTPENLNKLESQFGRSYRDALENMLYRMKTGSNRPKSLGKIESAALEWINGSVGVTMFFNTRSAALQLLSIPNYINLKDNNPFKAGAKFANQKQFWGDFMTLMNSNWAVSRRNGIKLNVTESEIAEAAARSGNKAQGAINYMLEKGFIFTKFADGFATAFGGSTMYRNRIETYKKEGFSEKEAKEKAMKDWEEISETTQQSGRTDKISQEQASLGGRLVLAFGNTGMQYTRIPKRAVQDLVNRRISPGSKTQFESDATNVSKAVYYSTITSALFVGLQNALFEAAFNPDADIDDKKVRAAENMVDNALRGTGIYGAALGTMRSVASKLYKESQDKRPEYVEAAWETLNVSPPIDIKVSKFKSAFRSLQYDMEEMKEKGALNPTNPAYLASAQVISGVTNLPLDRLFRKVDNLNSALQENRDTWQRIALIGGYSDYELGIEKDKKSKTFDNKRIFDRPNTRKKIIGIPKRKKIF